MDLIERYLAAVAGQLPQRQREDVVAELRDLLLSMKEEREEGLGRPLTDAEIDALLHEVGHPLVVAGRYRRIQHLVGPEIFPFYLFGLKIVLLCVVAVQIVVVGISVAVAPKALQGLAAWPGTLWNSLIISFAWVTLVAVAVEQMGYGKKLASCWRVQELPPPRARRPKGRFELACEAAMGVVFLLWWTGVIHFRPFVLGHFGQPQSVDVEMSSAWAPFWTPILVYSAARLATNLVDMIRPAWVRFSAVFNAAVLFGGAFIAGQLCRAGQLFTFTSPSLSAEQLAQIGGAVAVGTQIGFAVMAAILAVQGLAQVWRLVRSYDVRHVALA